ncbi:MAG: hypothetical protein AAF039_02220 [Bacteroidota bacterium]
MSIFDVVLLTADNYLDSLQQSPLAQNVRVEDGLVAEALSNEGLKIALKSWADPLFDWTSTKYILIRTPWDYFERTDEFLQWFNATSKTTVFINSAALIRWNFDKNYLRGLEQKGIAIPKTYFISKGSKMTLKKALNLAEEAFERTCTSWVLKPCIAAGAFHTYRFTSSESATLEEKFQQLIIEGDFMLQEFQENILTQGEISLVLFGTTFSHAIVKKAKSGDFRVQDDYGGTVALHEASPKEIDFALRVVEACNELPVYARVDVLEDNKGKLVLAELEIFEPELWFRFQPESAQMLAKDIKNIYFA